MARWATAAAIAFCSSAGVAEALERPGSQHVYTLAGFGKVTHGDCGSGVATRARLGEVGAVAAAPGGDVAYLGGGSLCRLAADGTVLEIAHRPIAPVNVGASHGLVALAAGSYLLTDTEGHRVVRIGPNGGVATMAGTGTRGFSGDSGPATSAELSYPNDLALTPDGSVLIAEQVRVRKVSPDGIITTVAGNGHFPDRLSPGAEGDGGPATSAALAPTAVAALPDGGFLVGHDGVGRRVLRRVTHDGTIQTISWSPRDVDVTDIVTDGGPPFLLSTDTAGMYAMSSTGGVSEFLPGDGRPDVLDGDGQRASRVEFDSQTLARAADGGLLIGTSDTWGRGGRIQLLAPADTSRLAAAVTAVRSGRRAAVVKVRYTRKPTFATLDLIIRGKVVARHAVNPNATAVTVGPPDARRRTYTLRLTARTADGQVVTDEVPALLGVLPVAAARAAMRGLASELSDIGSGAGVSTCRRFAPTRVDCLIETSFDDEPGPTRAYAIFLRPDGQIYHREYRGPRPARRPHWVARTPTLMPADWWSYWLRAWQ